MAIWESGLANSATHTLFVFGGLAALESEPRRPRDEILIAVGARLLKKSVTGSGSPEDEA